MHIADTNHTVQYITKLADLQACVKVLDQCTEIGFDLEFDNNLYTYGFNLCLIQIATDKHCFLIDPQVFKLADLQPLWAIFASPAILKIIHAGGEDYRLLQKLGCSPKNLFDTELCANMLGYEKTALSSVVLQNLNVAIDKNLQTSNWSKRPLTESQLRYAAYDVLYLLDLHKALVQQLANVQRQEWFAQEMSAIENTTFEIVQKTDFVKKADRDEFSEFDLFVLTELFKFRDDVARHINKPAYQVFSDDFVRDLVRNPAQLAQWTQLRGVIHYVKNETFGLRIEAAYARIVESATAQQLSTDRTVSKRLSAADWATINQERQALKEAKEKIFGPIKAQLAAQHGDFLANTTLSNQTMADLVAGRLTISDFKIDYKRTILQQTAEQLNLDLSSFYK
jgi:ribonuclease D